MDNSVNTPHSASVLVAMQCSLARICTAVNTSIASPGEKMRYNNSEVPIYANWDKNWKLGAGNHSSLVVSKYLFDLWQL